MEEYTFINKDRKRTKVFKLFKLFKDVSNSSPFIDGIEIRFECFNKRVDKPIYKRERDRKFSGCKKKI